MDGTEYLGKTIVEIGTKAAWNIHVIRAYECVAIEQIVLRRQTVDHLLPVEEPGSVLLILANERSGARRKLEDIRIRTIDTEEALARIDELLALARRHLPTCIAHWEAIRETVRRGEAFCIK
jgi:hypothetical protein